jgi:hypothetical protein
VGEGGRGKRGGEERGGYCGSGRKEGEAATVHGRKSGLLLRPYEGREERAFPSLANGGFTSPGGGRCRPTAASCRTP